MAMIFGKRLPLPPTRSPHAHEYKPSYEKKDGFRPTVAMNGQVCGNTNTYDQQMMLNTIFGSLGFLQYAVSGAGGSEETEEAPTTRPFKDDDYTTSDLIKDLLGEEVFNSLSDDLKEDVVQKYENLRAFRTDLSNEELKTRLEIYIKATQAGEQREAVKAFVTETLKNAGITDYENMLDEIIEHNNLIELYDPSSTEQEKSTLKERIVNFVRGNNYLAAERALAAGCAEGAEAAEDYTISSNNETIRNDYTTLSESVVEAYDTIVTDKKITLDEFIAYQTAIAGVELDDESLAIVGTEFDMIDADNDGYIDANEMKIELHNTATINDANDTNTAQSITQEEYKTIQTAKEAYINLLIDMGITSPKDFERTYNLATLVAAISSDTTTNEYKASSTDTSLSTFVEKFNNLNAEEREALYKYFNKIKPDEQA